MPWCFTGIIPEDKLDLELYKFQQKWELDTIISLSRQWHELFIEPIMSEWIE